MAIKRRLITLAEEIDWYLRFCNMYQDESDEVVAPAYRIEMKEATCGKARDEPEPETVSFTTGMKILGLFILQGIIATIFLYCALNNTWPFDGKTNRETVTGVKYVLGRSNLDQCGREDRIYYRVAVTPDLETFEMTDVFHDVIKNDKHFYHTVMFYFCDIADGWEYVEYKETPECLEKFYFK